MLEFHGHIRIFVKERLANNFVPSNYLNEVAEVSLGLKSLLPLENNFAEIVLGTLKKLVATAS